VPLDDFKLDAIPPEPLAAFLEEHGFTSLLKRLGDGRGSPERKVQLNPAKVVTPGAAAPVEGARQPLPACRRSTATFTPASRPRMRCRSGSSAPSPRGWWLSIPKPARSTR
jgi:hypothetical protein